VGKKFATQQSPGKMVEHKILFNYLPGYSLKKLVGDRVAPQCFYLVKIKLKGTAVPSPIFLAKFYVLKLVPYTK
jgi:hypothetical protein